jgi:hypothetical protein
VAGDEGGEEPPVKGDDGGDTSVAPVDVLPAAPAAQAKAILNALPAASAVESVDWAIVEASADRSDVAAVAAYFTEVAALDAQIPTCDQCLDTIRSLLAGDAVLRSDLDNLLIALTTIG